MPTTVVILNLDIYENRTNKNSESLSMDILNFLHRRLGFGNFIFKPNFPKNQQHPIRCFYAQLLTRLDPFCCLKKPS